jgi:hypothetical protein
MKFRKTIGGNTKRTNSNLEAFKNYPAHETIPLKGPSEVRPAWLDMEVRKLLAQIQNVQIQICTRSKTTIIMTQNYVFS